MLLKQKKNNLNETLASHAIKRSQWGIFALLGAMGLIILICLRTMFEVVGIRAERNNSFVIQPDGVSQRAKRIPDLSRTSEQLNRFTWEYTKTCYTWNGQFDGSLDRGVRVYGRVVPRVFFNCLQALDPSYRQDYAQQFYDTYAKHPLLKDTISLSAFLGNRVGTPRQAQIWPTTLPECPKEDKSDLCISSPSPGIYKVPIASKRIFLSNGLPYATPETFNLLYTLKAVSPYRTPWTRDQSEFDGLLDHWHAQGLMIMQIQKLPDTVY